MNRRKSIPDPVIVPLQPISGQISAHAVQSGKLIDTRTLQVEEFLQARSLTPKSQKAYRQDLQHFLNWTDKEWAEVTPYQATQFKAHLGRKDLKSGQRVLSDATVRRILGTLKNFYRWMVHSGYVSSDPTSEVNLPKLKESETQTLKNREVEQIYQAASESRLPERNVALISVLLHGLKTESISALNIEDYDRGCLQIRNNKTDDKALVLLNLQGKTDLETYLRWRENKGEVLQPEQPLFISHSHRNNGARLGYDGIRKVIDAISEKTGIDFHAHQFRHTFKNVEVEE